jgi:hypothetical protein
LFDAAVAILLGLIAGTSITFVNKPSRCRKLYMTNTRTLTVAAIAFCVCLFAAVAYAAPLNFSSNTPVGLTSPVTTLTILSGSAADAFKVNATSVIVSLSNSTGGSFTLTSAAYDLFLSQTGTTGTTTQTCISGLATVTISQPSGAGVYTIAPTGSQCGGASPTPTPTPTPTPIPTPTPDGGTILPPFPITFTPPPANLNTATSTLPTGISEGDLVRGPDDIKVYIVNAYGYIRHIFNPKVFSFYHHFKWTSVKNLDLTTFAILRPSDLYRADGDTKVYSLKEVDEQKGIAQKRWLNITAGDFTSLLFDPRQIFTINAQERDYYQNGVSLTKADFPYTVRRNQLVQVEASSTVYFIDVKGYIRPIPSAATRSYGYDYERVTIVTPEELASYPRIKAITLKNGDGKIYLLDGNTTQWIKDPATFSALELNWNDVAIVNQAEVNAYAEADPIE